MNKTNFYGLFLLKLTTPFDGLIEWDIGKQGIKAHLASYNTNSLETFGPLLPGQNITLTLTKWIHSR